MARTLATFLLAASFALSTAAFAGDKCTIATKPENDVGKACAEGGIKAAKKVMKEMTKQAKAKGMKVDCDSCHKDTESKFELTDNAKQDFQKMLDLTGRK